MDRKDIYSLRGELIPGLTNDIALNEIASKLPWIDLHVLSAVNHSWRQIIKLRVVYDARVLWHSTETLVVLRVENRSDDENEIVLYSLRDMDLYVLPQLPHLWEYEFIALEGNLYIFGGIGHGTGTDSGDGQNVLVLDLAGLSTEWKQCAPMLEPRRRFGCNVMDGKIYVFGGTGVKDNTPICRSEVYDPKINTWFPIQPMVSGRMFHRVTSVGKELFVQGGVGVNGNRFEYQNSWQVYHPHKDEWSRREVEPFRTGPLNRLVERVFELQGLFYSMDCRGIKVYDTKKKLWRLRCPLSCDSLGPLNSLKIDPFLIVPVNNEIVTLVRWDREDNKTEGWALLQSRGFGSNSKEVVWSRAPYNFSLGDVCLFMCPVQL